MGHCLRVLPGEAWAVARATARARGRKLRPKAIVAAHRGRPLFVVVRASRRVTPLKRASTTGTANGAIMSNMRTEDVFLGDLMSLPAAAQQLQLHRATVNDMVLAGRLKGYRLGPHWYVRRSDVEVFRQAYRRPKSAVRRLGRESHFFWTNEIVRWLLHWHDASAGELDRVLDLHVGNIRKYLALAEQDNLVERNEYGSWRLTASGRERAQALPRVAASTYTSEHA